MGAFLIQFPLFTYYRVDTDIGRITDHGHLGFAMFVGSFTLLFVILGLTWLATTRAADRTALAIVLVFGALMGATMVLVYPITAIDLFTYVAQSRILIHYHQNPLLVPPSRHFRDPLMHLAGGWATKPAPYGPLGVLMDAVPNLIAGSNLLLNLLLTKIMFTGFLLLEGGIVFGIVKKIAPALAVAAAVLIVWNPLMLFETSANGHNDIVMIVLASAGLLALVEGDLAFGIFLGTASVLVKYATLPLIPLFIVFAGTRPLSARARVRVGLTGVGFSGILIALAYVPFWSGMSTFSRSLLEDRFHLQSVSSVIAELWPGLGLGPATLIGRLLFLVVYLYALMLATKRPSDLVKACFIAMFGFFALGAANFKIWYATSAVIFGSCLPGGERLPAFCMAYGASASAALYAYVFVWLGQTSAAFDLVNMLAYVVTFLPAMALLLVQPVSRLVRSGVSDALAHPLASLAPAYATAPGRPDSSA